MDRPQLLVLLALWRPFLLGLLSLALTGLAAWPRLPKWGRVPAGALGCAVLLFALWTYVFRPIFIP